MTLGYRLSEAGHRVTVLEAGPQIGGLATWFDYGNFTWDKYYHVILRQDEQLLALINDLGLLPRMRWRETKTGFLWRGKLVSMSNNWEFLRFPVLSLAGKARLALGILYIQRMNDAGPLERTTAAKWLTRVFGRRVFERIWEPLLRSKFGVLYERVPAVIMWATIRRYYKTRSKGDGKETLGFLGGGLKSLFEGLEHGIVEAGGSVETSADVTEIVAGDAPGVAVRAGGDVRWFDRVISTVPSKVFDRLAPEAGLSVSSPSGAPNFLGVVCLALVLKRPLSPFYVTNLIEEGMPFTGVIEVSALTGPDEVGGNHLVMLPRYDEPESAWFERPEAEVASEFLTALRRIMPDIEDNVERYFVHRAKHVQALWIKEPPNSQGPRHTADGRIWSVNAEMAGRDTLNNNAIVRVANDAARLIAEPGVRAETAVASGARGR
jgi:protoporphyrinogen oxidase